MDSVDILSDTLCLSQVSTDLMIGLPHQTVDSFTDTLARTCDMGFGHISLYILQLEPNTPFHKTYVEGQ